MNLSPELTARCLALAGVSVPTPAPVVVTEKEFQAQVEREAVNRGWLAYHVYLSKKSRPGFPDCVFARDKRIILVELKAEDGKLSPEQEEWKAVLEAVGGTVEYYVWRPSMTNDIILLLQ